MSWILDAGDKKKIHRKSEVHLVLFGNGKQTAYRREQVWTNEKPITTIVMLKSKNKALL